MPTLFDDRNKFKSEGPVECLGMTFENDGARRAYFLEKLKEKLKDPEFRKIEGFPIGKDEDILALSDPPYYTACPNPFIPEFIKLYGKPYDATTDNYKREPFATDVSEGKNHPIYNAHSYHTKVPHKAIMRYILHYTEPGDVVFDGFGGTGMTGVAAQFCGDKKAVEELGYRVDSDGVVSAEEKTDGGKSVWKPFSKLGARRAVLNDLSPAATFIAYNYNTPVDAMEFEREAKRILDVVEAECGWMYATLHEPKPEQMEQALALLKQSGTTTDFRNSGLPFGRINYTVWSDVFICPQCSKEIVFWEAAVDKKAGEVQHEFPCPHCRATQSKRSLDRAWMTVHDSVVGQNVRRAKQVPVLVNYTFGGKRYEKAPDSFDSALIYRTEETEIPHWFPSDPMLFKGERWGDTWRAGVHAGITHVHQFYTKRSLSCLAAFYGHLGSSSLPARSLLPIMTGGLLGLTRLQRYRPMTTFPNMVLSGTLYVGSLQREWAVPRWLSGKLRSWSRVLSTFARGSIIETRSATANEPRPQLVDYVFTDPPFGGNLMYSELNFLWESWLRVFTNIKPEAVENDTQGKGLPEYQSLMTRSFQEYYQALKPGRWMTVEFHNSQNRVWNTIQEALQEAGFVVADVRTLDKERKTMKQIVGPGTVKQDLIISAYKPNGGLEQRFKLEAGTEDGVWDFTRTHLRQLSRFVEQHGKAEVIAERLNYLLYDRMVAFHVRRGISVPTSAAEFYDGLEQRFAKRDGMYFLAEQVAEYDRRRLSAREVEQLSIFVTDEASAIQWLRQQLEAKPQTFSEIHPLFMQEVGGWQKHEKPLELKELLEETFLCYDGVDDVPNQIHSYLSTNFPELRKLSKDNPLLRKKAKDRWYMPDPKKAKDVEQLREKALLREFWEYLPPGFKLDKPRASKEAMLPIPGLEATPSALPRGRKIKVIRTEAVRVGFKHCWQNHLYDVIVAIAQRIPENVLQEDPKLLMWYTLTLTRTGRD